MKSKKPLSYNWATEEDFAQSIVNNLMDIWEGLKSARGEREEVWMESYRAWTADRLGVDNSYQGRANLYWPQVRKEVETMTRRMMKGIFTDDYLRATSDKFEDEDLTAVNTQIVEHYLDNVMHFPIRAEPWLKQGVLYGTSPLRTFWRKEENEQFFKERYFVQNKEGILEPRTKTVQKKVVGYNGPVARPEDIFQTWVYPHTIQHITEAQALFFRTKITWQELLQRANTGMCVNINEDLKETIDKDLSDKLEEFKFEGKTADFDFPRGLERLLQFSDSGQYQAIGDNKYYDLHEIWTKIQLPDTDVPVPVVIEVLIYSHPIRVQRNPFWHQSPPFDFFRFIKPPPGEYYGRGLPEATLPMQAQLNDMLNQGMDSATLALNPITIINPAFAPNSESFEVEPGAQWYADPQGIKSFSFPDLSTIGIKNAQVVRGIITEMSDNSPQLPDPISGKARSTGQAQMAIDEWSTDLFAFLRSISEEGLSPLAQKLHMLIQQNLSDDDIIKVTGKYAGTMISRVVTPDEILGNYNFHWTTSLQIQQQQVKTQQMLGFVKVYAQLPPDAQAKIKFNWEVFLTKLLRDGFLIKDVTSIIETARMTMSTPPDIENRIMKLGGIVKVTESDDDDAHISSHSSEREKLAKTNLYERANFDQHIQLHDQQKQEKLQAQQQQQMQQQQQQMMMQQMMASKGKALPPGQPPQAANPGSGNQGQINESQNVSDMNRGMGVNNG